VRNFGLAFAFAAIVLAGCDTTGTSMQRPTQACVPTLARLATQHEGSAAPLLLQAINGRGVVLLGEMHGTQEAPMLAGQLVSHYASQCQPVRLGLEIAHDEQPGVDRFLDSHGDEQARRALLAGAQWRAPFDGRDSEAMFELIDLVRRLRASGADVGVVYFDDADPDMTRRNLHMADVLRAAAASAPRATLLVLTGNVHAMTHAPPGGLFLDGKRLAPPMSVGRDLSDLHPLSIDIDAASGEYRACMHGQCRLQSVQPHATLANPALEKPAPGESAWDFTLTLPRFHASAPALQALESRHADVPEGTKR
jgi:hypothetical protein